MSSQKVQYVQSMISAVTELDNLRTRLMEQYGMYWARGYNSGGSDPIADADIASLERTATQVSNIITMIDNINKLLSNQTPITGDYDTTINTFRDIP